MNFPSHAYVAGQCGGGAAVALGAMLPDFFGMAGARGARAREPDLEAGIRLHHLTDEAFHADRRFVALSTRAGDRLEALGVARGPARAASHVGVELLLDGVVLALPGARDLYLGALALAPLDAFGGHIEFRADEHRDQYDRLVQRLIGFGLPDGLAGPDMVAERLERTLARRPRLALDARSLVIVREWLVEAHREVHAVGDELVRSVTSALARSSGSSE